MDCSLFAFSFAGGLEFEAGFWFLLVCLGECDSGLHIFYNYSTTTVSGAVTCRRRIYLCRLLLCLVLCFLDRLFGFISSRGEGRGREGCSFLHKLSAFCMRVSEGCSGLLLPHLVDLFFRESLYSCVSSWPSLCARLMLR